MGPAINNTAEQEDEVSMNEFIDDFFKPWYKSTEGDESEQVEGEDPILEVEKIVHLKGMWYISLISMLPQGITY